MMDPAQNQPDTVTKKTVVQRLMFDFGLHELPHMGDIGDN